MSVFLISVIAFCFSHARKTAFQLLGNILCHGTTETSSLFTHLFTAVKMLLSIHNAVRKLQQLGPREKSDPMFPKTLPLCSGGKENKTKASGGLNVLSNHNEHYVEKKYPRDKGIMVVGSEATEKYDTIVVRKSIVSEKIFKQGDTESTKIPRQRCPWVNW